jgi:glycosyltransferase involved in cell wall biosynthesis
MPHLSIIIPIFNEEPNIGPLHEKLTSTLAEMGSEYEIIFVDDGSTDDSVCVLEKLTAQDPHCKSVHFKRNFGQTAAMMAGFDYSSGEIIIPMDGDGQNDPADIPKLLAKLDEGFDVCSGWRSDRKDNALMRTFPSRVANRLISWISGVHLNDYGCSLKAYRREIIKDVKLYGEMHRFIPIFASWQGAKVTEIPVNHYAREHGQSKYGIERTFKVILDLMVVKFMASYSQKPIYFFGGFGLLSIFMSFICFVAMLYFKFWGGKTFIQTPLPVLVAMLFLVGFMSILMGLIADLVMRTYYESQDKKTYVVGKLQNIKDQD